MKFVQNFARPNFHAKKLHRNDDYFHPKENSVNELISPMRSFVVGKNLHLVCVDLQNKMLKAHSFLEKFTQLAKIFYNRRS